MVFFYENVLDFVDEDVIDDVVVILVYFGDVDILLSRYFKGFFYLFFLNDIILLYVVFLVVGFVVVCGVLFVNIYFVLCKW